MKKLTFKEYLESKQVLLKAVENTPRQISEYEVNKYCKLVVGETKQTKHHINLRPKQKIIVEWFYDDLENPTIKKINFQDVVGINENDKYTTYWGGARLLRWLSRNTNQTS